MPDLLASSKCNCDWNWLEGEKRNNLAAVISGILFFTGWWIMIDVAASGLKPHEFHPAYYLVGLCGTIALIMVNSVSKAHLRGDALGLGDDGDGCLGMFPIAAWLWLFAGFFMSFACCIAACWILIGGFLTQDSIPKKWPGGALLLQNLLIFSSSMIFKFGRVEVL